MSDLISTPPAPASPIDSEIAIDAWFPPIDVNELRDSVRLGENMVTHPRLVAAIEGAILTALRNLAEWRTAHATAGVASLDTVPDTVSIGNTPRTVILWRRIIRHYTAAQLADEYRDLVAADQQVQRAEEQRSLADHHRRMAHHAVADLLSIGADTPVQRNGVELI